MNPVLAQELGNKISEIQAGVTVLMGWDFPRGIEEYLERFPATAKIEEVEETIEGMKNYYIEALSECVEILKGGRK